MPIQRWCRLLAFLLILSAGYSHSQRRSTASIQGMVLGAQDEPLRKVTVELRASEATGPADPALATTQSDIAGKFYFPAVLPGRYRLVASAAGYVRTIHTQVFVLADGQSTSDVRITMRAGGVISGRITEKGEPVALADVVAIRPIYTEGQLSLTPVLADRTNDRGEYNLFWLPPGRYYIVAILWDTASAVGFFVNPDGSDANPFFAQRMESRAVLMRTLGTTLADNEAHVPFYYPGTADPQFARLLEVLPGSHLRGIDVNVSSVLTRRVTGGVTGLSGLPTTGGQNLRASLSLRPIGASLNTNAAQTPSVQSDALGNFQIPRAISGRYVLTATAGNMTGRVPVEIRDADVNGVLVPLGSGISVSGRVVVEGRNALTQELPLTNLRVTLRTDPLLPGATAFSATPRPDGSFTIPSPPASPSAQPLAAPPPGEYRVLVTPLLTAPTSVDAPSATVPAAWRTTYVKSMTFGTADILNGRLQLRDRAEDSLLIVIGTNPAHLDGRVLSPQQRPISGATVVLVHDDGLRYRVNEKYTATDSTGRFEFENVPPGSYKLFSWEAIEKGVWNDPQLMREYESYAVPVEIKESEKISLELKAIPSEK